ncbi:MAG TPA: HlyD family efflux transporter periplasmic adaptor subunit [Candidatus Dormibacteraeota bacterium]|nr:HlyD family efflux transporter periplasmic adaptor subunit [Candidatus Dormibacteraeota bacterium]
MPKTRRTIVVLLVALALAAALTFAAFRPRPVLVEVGAAMRGPLQVTVEAEGVTRVRDRFVVSAPVAGRLGRVGLSEGDRVRAGMLLARIDPLPERADVRAALAQLDELRAQRAGVATLRPKAAALAQADAKIAAVQARRRYAEARVEQARALVAKARSDLARDERLAGVGGLPRSAVESARVDEQVKSRELEAALMESRAAASEVAAAKAMRAELEASRSDPDYLLKVYDARIAGVEADLTKLRDAAARTDVRAPAGGRVLRVLQKSEQFVSAGAPLVEIGDPGNLEIVVDVLSSDAVRVAPGARMSVDVGSGAPLQGVVTRVEPSAFTKVSSLGIEEQRVHVIGSLAPSPAEARVGDGYRVEASIVVWRAAEVLKAPLSAAFRCGRQWCVFTIRDGRAHRREIEIGQRSDAEVEILRGLSAGDRLVLNPGDDLSDGTPVRAE